MQAAAFTVKFDRIQEALSAFLGPAVAYLAKSNPFSVSATLSEWQVTAHEVLITIADGTLIDLDKGSFPLSGLVVRVRAEGAMAPIGLVSGGVLSELQQAVVVDSVTGYLNQPGLSYRVDSGGLHITAGDRKFQFCSEKTC